jgi:hypothetical protein
MEAAVTSDSLIARTVAREPRRGRNYEVHQVATGLQSQTSQQKPVGTKKFIAANGMRKTDSPNNNQVKYNTTTPNPVIAEQQNSKLQALIVERARQIK